MAGKAQIFHNINNDGCIPLRGGPGIVLTHWNTLLEHLMELSHPLSYQLHLCFSYYKSNLISILGMLMVINQILPDDGAKWEVNRIVWTVIFPYEVHVHICINFHENTSSNCSNILLKTTNQPYSGSCWKLRGKTEGLRYPPTVWGCSHRIKGYIYCESSTHLVVSNWNKQLQWIRSVKTDR